MSLEEYIIIYLNKDGGLESPYIKDAEIPKKVLKTEGDQKLSKAKLYYNGKLVDEEFVELPILTTDIIKLRRQNECFSIIDNRSQMGYNHLTDIQKQELETGYQAGLDAPETKIIPETPEGLK